MRACQETSCPCATEGMCAGQETPAEGVPTSQLGQSALLKSPANTHTKEWQAFSMQVSWNNTVKMLLPSPLVMVHFHYWLWVSDIWQNTAKIKKILITLSCKRQESSGDCESLVTCDGIYWPILVSFRFLWKKLKQNQTRKSYEEEIWWSCSRRFTGTTLCCYASQVVCVEMAWEDIIPASMFKKDKSFLVHSQVQRFLPFTAFWNANVP